MNYNCKIVKIVNKFVMKLPTELIDIIVLYTNDINIANALEGYISQYVFDKIEKNILIYGDVQSGKTNEIIKFLKKERHICIPKVLVIQNSLLVLKQYIKKLQKNNIDFQVVTKNTIEIKKNVIVLLNNSYRYKYFEKLKNKSENNLNKYILMIDESDQSISSCKLKSYKTIHITATPFNYPKKLEVTFNSKIIVNNNLRERQYYGINDLIVNQSDTLDKPVDDFLSTNNGLMLINKFSYIDEMKQCAITLSKKYSKVPIVLLNSDKFLYYNKKIVKIKEKSITDIIDSLNKWKHVIFIANRLSNRGLSYTSSDFTRHLTHQITRVRINPSSFLQSLRILGIYKYNLELKLTIDDTDLFEKHLKKINDFKMKICKN